MTILDAWKLSSANAACHDRDGLVLTVVCTREDTLTVIIGPADPRALKPEQLGDLLKILSINPEEGWNPA